MLMTLLASIGLFFIIISVYKKGKRDGVKDTIDYFLTEMKRKEINAEIIVGKDFTKFGKSKKTFLLPFLKGRK